MTTPTTTDNAQDTPRRGGYDWTVDDSRKLNDRLGRLARRRDGAETVEAEAARRGVSTEQVRLDRLPPYLREQMTRIARETGTPATDLIAESPADRAAEAARGMQEWRNDKVDTLLSRIPSVYRNAVPRLNASRRWIEGYLGGERQTLVLLGEVGTGKTWEAYAIMRILLVEHTVPATLITTSDLMAMLRPNDDGFADVGLMQSAPVLILDDLGAERLTEWGAEQFERVANFRHDRDMPVIVTSNLTREQILERYDPRLVRRLFGQRPSVQIVQRSHRDRGIWSE